MRNCVKRPHSVKFGNQKSPFQAPFGEKKKKNVHHCKSKTKKSGKSGKAPRTEINIGSYV